MLPYPRSASPTAAPTLPYPRSASPTGAAPLFVVSERGLSPADMVTVGTLAGVVARAVPQIYTVAGGLNDTATDAAAFWLSELSRTTPSLRVNATFLHDLPGLLTHFGSSHIDGFVTHNANTSANAALTACAGSAGRVIVASSPATTALMRTLGVPLVWNVSGLTPLEVFTRARGRLSGRMAAFAPDDGSKRPHLAAYAAFGRLASVEFPTGGSAAAAAVMGSLSRTPSELTAALGWTSWDEFQYVSRLAAAGAWAHASDWSDNLTPLANLPVHGGVPRRARFASSPPLPARRPLAGQAAPPAHTVAFLMSDGDNLCWLQGGWRQAQWFGAPERGAVPLGWTFSPGAAELLPTVLAYAADGATANDSFVGAPSAVGYTYPDLLPAARVGPMAAATAALLERANMRTLNVIGSVPAAEPLEALLAHDELDGLFWYSYGDGYSGLRGNVAWVHGKPVVGGRVSLWGDGSTGDMIGVDALPAALTGLPTEPTDPNSYSLIPVNAWSHNYSDVVRAAQLLSARGGFDVVSPEELVRRLTASARGRETCPLPRGPWRDGCIDCDIAGHGSCVMTCSNCGGVAMSCDLSVCHDGLRRNATHLLCADGRVCPG